jgi:hypothetical protein
MSDLDPAMLAASLPMAKLRSLYWMAIAAGCSMDR